MIYRGFTYKAKVTPAQHEVMLQHAGVCRLVWNLALDQRVNHWRNYQKVTGDNLNFVTQSRQLTELRREVDFVRAVSQEAEQLTIKALDIAFRRFFSGNGGFPKFKKAGVGDSFSFPGRNCAVEKINKRWARVKLPKIGWVRVRYSRPIVGSLTLVTVTRLFDGWQISIGCKREGCVSEKGTLVGIDRGVTIPLMLSNGVHYVLPHHVVKHSDAARKAQKVASRRKRGSVRHAKGQRRVAVLKAREARCRKHWAHCATTEIARHCSTVVIERLRTKNMTKSSKGTISEPGKNVAAKSGLNRAILNVGWFQIENMLSYKCANVVKVNPAHTSQTCSTCGSVDQGSRKNQATFVCTACGHHMNADLNAAINILNRGNTPGVEPVRWDGVEAHTS